MKKDSLTYKDAGVDIEAGNQLVSLIKPIASRTHRPGVLSGIGGFGALFELPLNRYKNPVLVSSTDGVGTKLKLALAMKTHDTIGIDLVAMCVNDLIVQGAEPLFFLDYFATSHLQVDVAAEVIKGIGVGCEQAGAALVGGETAEMPGIYSIGEYDLAGFAVGIVEKDKIIDGSKVANGDILIGIASSGVHSNGYSLVRKIIEDNNISFLSKVGGHTLGEALLLPTRIYVKSILKLLEHVDVHAMAHITGGGFIDNIPRVLPPYTKAIIDANSWQQPPIFNWLQTHGNIPDLEMYRTFNCGIGMILAVAKKDASNTVKILNDLGEEVWPIGVIESSSEREPVVVIE